MQEGGGEQSPVTDEPDSLVTIADLVAIANTDRLIKQMRRSAGLSDEVRVPSNGSGRRPTAGETRRARAKAEATTSQDLTIQPEIIDAVDFFETPDNVTRLSDTTPVAEIIRPYVLEGHLAEIDTTDQVTGLWMYGFRAIEQWGRTFYPPKKPGVVFSKDIGLTSRYGDNRRIRLDAVCRTASPLYVLLYDTRNQPTLDCRFLDEETALRKGKDGSALKAAGIGLVIHPPSAGTHHRSTIDVTVYPHFSPETKPIVAIRDLKIYQEDLMKIPDKPGKKSLSIPQSWRYKPSAEGENTMIAVLRRTIIG